MIDSIEIKNFETHLNTEIKDLHPGVTVITGESDEGKSGIIRAITLNAQNRPIGDEYRNDNLDSKSKEDKLKETSVKINYKGTGSVTRARDGFAGGINHYQINDNEPLRAIRTDVPDEVQEMTLMKSVNIQGQHPNEQYFLLADKPGQVAKEFNKVAGLTIMDKALADINSQVRDCNSSITLSKKEIETRTEELKETEWILKAEAFANKLKSYKNKMLQKEKDHSDLNYLIKQIIEIDSILKTEFHKIDSALAILKKLAGEKQNMINTKEYQTSIISLVSTVKSVDLLLAECLHTDLALNALETLKNESKEIKNKERFLNSIRNLILELKTMEEEICFAETDYKDALALFNELKITTECPTCGRKGI